MFKYLLVDHAVPAMCRPCRGLKGGLAIRERTNHPRTPPDLAQDALERVVGTNASEFDRDRSSSPLLDTRLGPSCPADF
jgi:hypothetical protein